MNSQKKQQSGKGIKTDKYGVPLNYGNYKNGKLIVKKKGGGKAGRGGGGGRGNSGSGRGAGRGTSINLKLSLKQSQKQSDKSQKQRQQQTQQQKKKEAQALAPASVSVGLTGAAHNVIKEALLSSSTVTAANFDCAPPTEGGYANGNANGNNATKSNDAPAKKQRPKHNRSSPDLKPPPKIQDMGPMGDQRRGLPVYKFKDKLLKTIAKHNVTVVEGETGSGKTTQVPQFCLENAADQGVPCNIIIAQPRRISAMSVAERVANERGETIGNTVGYTIRLESKATSNTRLLFCTTGILLKRLEEDPLLKNITHVFVDEVHERSIESDFLLMVLKDMLPKRDEATPLKVVLMSATLDASLFHDYFGGAPSVKFPGRTFPVTELYLEDALEVTNHIVRGNEDWCNKSKKGGNSGTPGNGGKKGAPPPPVEDQDDMLISPQDLAARYAEYSPNTQMALSKLDHNAIDYPLIVDTIQWLSNLNSPLEAASYLKGASNKKNKNIKTGRQSKQSINGSGASGEKLDTTSSAILVFLPGIKEITTLQELLVKSSWLSSPATREWVLPLHSTIPSEEQRKVFTRPPKGVRKIVLTTNIAETAVTIDDVAFVVDTGRMKENRYDPLKRMSSLEDCLVAKSNARQRRGRAGRVREGVAVHLFTKHRHDKITLTAQAPEVQRVPLEQLVLRIKALQYPGTAAEVCARLVEPPAPEAVQRAVDELVFLEAMTINENSCNSSDKEELTALGVHLSTLPVDCRIGKLILLGAMFGVTDDALTIAASLSYRNPFMSPIAAREEADRAKMTFATGQSDLLTVLNAYKQVDVMGKARYDFCRENFISIKTMQTIAGLKRQLLELLSAAGFVRPGLRSRAVESVGRRSGGCDGVAVALEKGVVGGGKGGRGRNNVEEGDWKCTKCHSNNFARNKERCFRCKTARPKEEKSDEDEAKEAAEEAPEERILLGADDDNEFEKSLPLLKALLAAALFPQMVIVDDSKGSGKKSGGGGGGGITLEVKAEKGEKQEDMALHPSCITGKSKEALSSKYLVYHERVKTTRVYLRDATPVSPYALILFGGGRMKVEDCPRGGNESVLRLDGWLGFRCPRKDHLLVMELREVLDGILKHKVENPKQDFTEEAAGIIDAVKAILTMDEDGKVVAPEQQARRRDTYEMLHKRNTGGGRGKGSGRGGGKKPGRGGKGRGGGRGNKGGGRGRR